MNRKTTFYVKQILPEERETTCCLCLSPSAAEKWTLHLMYFTLPFVSKPEGSLYFPLVRHEEARPKQAEGSVDL